MDDNIVDDKHGGFNQPPVNIDVVFRCAGAPAVAGIDNLDLGNLDTE